MILPRSHRHLLVRGGTVVSMDPERRVLQGDVLVTEGRIAAVGPDLAAPPATRLLEAEGLHVFPGFIQGHLHLGQTLFRGLAEDLPLLEWLRDRIWPLEAAHTEETAYRAALLGAADCLLSGTTTVQDIGLVRGMEGVFRALEESGLRALAGKCLMDAGEGVPPALLQPAGEALAEAEALARRWRGTGRERIQPVVCPRFVLSASRELWEGAASLARSLGAPLHTHLLESGAEEKAVRKALGTGQLEFLDAAGVLDLPRVSIAHGVLLGKKHLPVLRDRRLGVVHCPSANAKLGSGVADLPFLRAQPNLAVGIGADGAACNNDLDVLEEMRLAALLQGAERGPGALPAEAALELATIGGARALGLEDAVGSLEPGKCGDLAVLDLGGPAAAAHPSVSPATRLVYGAGRGAVRWVVVDGEVLVQDGFLPHLDRDALLRRAAEAAEDLVARSGIL